MDTEILDWIAQRPMVSWSMLNVTVVIIRDMNTTTASMYMHMHIFKPSNVVIMRNEYY